MQNHFIYSIEFVQIPIVRQSDDIGTIEANDWTTSATTSSTKWRSQEFSNGGIRSRWTSPSFRTLFIYSGLIFGFCGRIIGSSPPSPSDVVVGIGRRSVSSSPLCPSSSSPSKLSRRCGCHGLNGWTSSSQSGQYGHVTFRCRIRGSRGGRRCRRFVATTRIRQFWFNSSKRWSSSDHVVDDES